MKVLHILNELKPSGAEVMLYSAGPLLKEYEIIGEILSTGLQPGAYAEALASSGYIIHHLPLRKNPWYFFALYRFLKGNRYDVIHLHTEAANFWFGIVALLCAKRCVRTIHNNFPFTGFLGWRRKWQRQILNKLGLHHIAISQSVHDTEFKHFRLTTKIIPNWYNSFRFRLFTAVERAHARQKLGIPEHYFVLISIGNCSEIKNHTTLISALAQVSSNNIIYLHIGIEKDDSERKLAEKLDITKKIIFAGMQTDVVTYLQAADLYVMPSLYEGCPISAIEAIACGLPALFTDVPGLTDFSAIFKGLNYCKSTPEAITTELTDIIALEPERLKENCSYNAQQAELIFSIESGLTAYANCYKS